MKHRWMRDLHWGTPLRLRGYAASRSALTLGEQLVEAQQSGINWWSTHIYIGICISMCIYIYLYYINIISYYWCRHSRHFFQTQMLPHQPFSAPWMPSQRDLRELRELLGSGHGTSPSMDWWLGALDRAVALGVSRVFHGSKEKLYQARSVDLSWFIWVN